MADISNIISDVPLWNCNQLVPPPEVFLSYSETELAAVLPVSAGVSADAGSQVATSLQALLNELHLLRSIAYRVGNQFSNCRAFRCVRSVTTCGRRLRLAVEPEWLAQRVAALARPQWRPGGGGGGTLPSRQLAQHLLVTCQRAGRLLSRLAELAERTARLWLQWLRLGHQAQLAVAFLGLLGRVWVLSRAGRARLCRLYAAVLPLESVLRQAAVPWPHDALPDCLWGWLGLLEGEGEGGAEVLVVRGSLRAARRRHDELPYEDQSREITVSLLSGAARGRLSEMFSGGDTGGDSGAGGRTEESDTDAEDGDREAGECGDPASVEDLGDSVLESDEEMLPVEDLGEVVDGDETFTIVSPWGNGAAYSPDCEAGHDDESDGQSAGENGGEVRSSAGPRHVGQALKSAPVSAGDRKLYRRVNKTTRQWTSWEDLVMFVKQESEARRQEREQCVTAQLTNAQWKQVKQGLKQHRVKWRKAERRGDQIGGEKVAKRAKLFVKTWSLFPSSEGRKPADWAEFLERVKNKRPSR